MKTILLNDVVYDLVPHQKPEPIKVHVLRDGDIVITKEVLDELFKGAELVSRNKLITYAVKSLLKEGLE